MNSFLNTINVTPEIGVLINVFLFVLMVLITYYRYYKSIYRLVYSSGKICLNCNENADWRKKKNLFKTRTIFYNNGRKTLTHKVIPFLSIKSKTKEILSAKVLENKEINIDSSVEEVEIKIEYLDSGEFIVVEIEHYGFLEVSGRIDESGKILNTETKIWLIINMIIVIFMCVVLFYSLNSVLSREIPLSDYIPPLLTIGLLLLMNRFVRFLHELFFIPDKISSKYLDRKSKLGKEFVFE